MIEMTVMIVTIEMIEMIEMTVMIEMIEMIELVEMVDAAVLQLSTWLQLPRKCVRVRVRVLAHRACVRARVRVVRVRVVLRAGVRALRLACCRRPSGATLADGCNTWAPLSVWPLMRVRVRVYFPALSSSTHGRPHSGSSTRVVAQRCDV